MTEISKQSSIWVFIVAIMMASVVSYANQDLEQYCTEKGGKVVAMTARQSGSEGSVEVISRLFCTFERDHGLIAIGLASFASEEPNIAASYLKKLPEIKTDSPLFKGGRGNPSYNVCKNLGGSAMSFTSSEGGESDICLFRDGSMVSTWSLIYTANHRHGYDEVKEQVRSEPLSDMP